MTDNAKVQPADSLEAIIGGLKGRLSSLAREVRAQAATRWAHRAVPCQTDESWHSEEFNEWAAEIESIVSGIARLAVQADAAHRHLSTAYEMVAHLMAVTSSQARKKRMRDALREIKYAMQEIPPGAKP